MAPKTKKNVEVAPDAKPVRLKKDGTPWATVTSKRTNAELLVDYQTRRAAFVEASTKTLAHFDRKIAFFSAASTTGEDAANEVLAGGMTVEEITALEAKLRKAKAVLKDKSPAEVEAMRAAAVASRAPVITYQDEEEVLPAFLAV